MFLIFLVGVFCGVAVAVLGDLGRSLVKSHYALVRVEQCLGVYKAGAFNENGQTLWPGYWQEKPLGRHFTRLLLLVGTAGMVSALFLLVDYLLRS